MTKFNGKHIEMILLQGHMTMRNWDAIERMRRRSVLFDRACIILAIGLMAYVAIR